MATFLLGPHMGRAEIESRVRLTPQRVTAIAQLSAALWFDTADVVVTNPPSWTEA